MALYEFDEHNIYKAFAIDSNGYHKDLEDISNESSNENGVIIYADTVRQEPDTSLVGIIIIDPDVVFTEIVQDKSFLMKYGYVDDTLRMDVNSNLITTPSRDGHVMSFTISLLENGTVTVSISKTGFSKDYTFAVNAE